MNEMKTREREREREGENKEYKNTKKKIVVVIFCGISTQLDGFENNSHLFCHLGQIQRKKTQLYLLFKTT